MRAAWQAFLTSAILATAGCANKTQPQPSLGLSRDIEPAPTADEPLALPVRREAWTYSDYDGILISTPNYRIFTTIDNERILDRLPMFYEGALTHYTSALAKLPKPQRPLESFLFQTRGQWQTKTAELLPDQANMFSNLGRGGFTTRGTSVLYYIDRFGYTRDTFAIAAHEGWHQYTQQTFRHQLPVWLEEGVATYMEGYRVNREGVTEFQPSMNWERREALRDAVRRGRMIPLYEVLTRSPQSFLSTSKNSLLTYYAQVWALTLFLAEGENGRYSKALETVLSDAADGRMVSRVMTSSANGSRRGGSNTRVGPAVVQEYFNRDLAEFEKQYLLFVDQLIQQREGPRR